MPLELTEIKFILPISGTTQWAAILTVDGAASNPEAGGWTYMLLGADNDANATFSHCVIRYGGGNWGGWGNDSLIIVNRDSTVSIDNCELAHSLLRGIRIEGATGTVSNFQ